MTEYVLLQGASGETSAAPLEKLAETEGKGMVDGEREMVEFETRAEEQREQEEQWPLPP